MLPIKHIFALVLCLFLPVTIAYAKSLFEITVVPPNNLPATFAKEQYTEPNAKLYRELKVKVTQNGIAAPKQIVEFSVASKPEKSTPPIIFSPIATTDANGYATTFVTLGNMPGDYFVTARIVENKSESFAQDSVFFKLAARPSHWMLILIMELCAGLAIFMLGINFLSEGMKKSSGQKLRQLLQQLTKHRFVALLTGIFVTVIFQSSTATTVMLVGLVQAGLLNFANTLGVILGADIGTTVTVQLISFQIIDYALWAVALGFLVWTMSKNSIFKFIGQAILGLGLVFFGISMMSSSVIPLRTHEPFLELLTKFNNPLLAILIGTAFSALLHSSAAFVGIVIAFAIQRIVAADTGIALCLGANIGTCVTALLASVGASVEAKRVAVGHTLFKIIGVLLIAPWITQFATLVSYTTFGGGIERQIANAHTIFNIGIAIVFFPFLGFFAKIIEKLVPLQKGLVLDKAAARIILDDTLIDTPVLALSTAKVEVLRLGRIAQQMLELSLQSIFTDAPFAKEKIKQDEMEIDIAYDAIQLYIKKVIGKGITDDRLEEAYYLLHTSNDFEQIADLIEDRILPLIEKFNNLQTTYPSEGLIELKDYYTKTLKQMSRALEVCASLDLQQAQHVSSRFEKYRLLASELQRIHFIRSNTLEHFALEAGEIHLELITTLLDISDLTTNVARNIIQRINMPKK